MGKKDGQQGDEENIGCGKKCIRFLQCCQLPAATGVKIVSIISILIGLVFCCLGVWMIIVTTNNNELAPRNQVVYELPQSSSPTNGSPALSVFNTVAGAKEQESISTQSSLFDTSSVYLTQSSSLSSNSNQGTGAASNGNGNNGNGRGNGNGGGGSNWPSSSVSTGKGPSGRRPPVLTHLGPKKLVPLSNYHMYLLCLGVLSICVGFTRTLASIFLLWNSVEKHSKTPGAVWIFVSIVGTVSMLIILGVTLNVTGFIWDFPWRPMSDSVRNDRFNFYLLLTMIRIVCVCDIFLIVYFVLVVLWFLRTVN